MPQSEVNEWVKYLKIEKELQKGDPLTEKGKQKKQAVELTQWAAQYNMNYKAKHGK